MYQNKTEKGRASASCGSGATIMRLPTDKEKTSPV